MVAQPATVVALVREVGDGRVHAVLLEQHRRRLPAVVHEARHQRPPEAGPLGAARGDPRIERWMQRLAEEMQRQIEDEGRGEAGSGGLWASSKRSTVRRTGLLS